jgi:hypothetical protein
MPAQLYFKTLLPEVRRDEISEEVTRTIVLSCYLVLSNDDAIMRYGILEFNIFYKLGEKILNYPVEDINPNLFINFQDADTKRTLKNIDRNALKRLCEVTRW